MELIVKSGRQRIDHPERHPDYKRLAKKSKRLYEKMRFESGGQKKDYDRAVAANPNNIPGVPAFYPPLQIRSFISMPRPAEDDPTRARRERWELNQIRDTDLFCETCDRITAHSVSPRDCFCKKCGYRKHWRT